MIDDNSYHIFNDADALDELIAMRGHELKLYISKMSKEQIREIQSDFCDKHEEINEERETATGEELESLNFQLFFLQLAMAKFEEIALPIVREKYRQHKDRN